jgi:hypothetical protein
MSREYDSKQNVELTDGEVFDAIRYLDPAPSPNENSGQINALTAICLSLILFVSYLAIVWLHGLVS